jgi:hypothetical protein
MDVSEACRLVTKYVHDRTGKRVDLNANKMIMDTRQQELLKKAVKVAVEYYNGTNIII